MKWSPQQDLALQKVDEWIQDPHAPQVFRLFGYAGTGKTTLAMHFAEGVGGVMFGAFTGKAAYVMRQKGCPGASTIHSMIYHSREKNRLRLYELEKEVGDLLMVLEAIEDQNQIEKMNRAIYELRQEIKGERKRLSTPVFELNPDSEVRHADLVIIDECSMVDGRLGEDLLSFGTKVLVLGDPAQLPPPFGAGFFTENVLPDVMLTEIHRQAAENPIIAMATKVRQEHPLPLGEYGSSKVSLRSKIHKTEFMEAGQILTGKNKTRHTINRRIREEKGIPDEKPVIGDKLVCLRNDHDLGLMNGAIFYVTDVLQADDEDVVMTIRPEVAEIMRFDGEDVELSLEKRVVAHAQLLYGNGDEDPMPWWERKQKQEFNYGYALTTHKSQGSQWDDVLVFDESYCFRENQAKWLYTALTRAAEKVTVVR